MGVEFRVNAYTSGAQSYPALASDAAGGFVVVWQDGSGRDGYDNGVFARRFSKAGAALASEFQVNTYTPSDQGSPLVAASSSGDFVVVWRSRYQDGSEYGAFARRFSSTGAALATEFQVNTYTANAQDFPSVAAAASGAFVVAWESDGQDGDSFGVFARRFSSSGVPLASEFQVNGHTTDRQRFPAVAADADGDFVVAWESFQGDGSSYGVFARRFSSAGVAIASEFQVNSFTANSQYRVAVAAHANGDFVLAWTSAAQDGSNAGIFARRFSGAGLPLTGELQVNTYTSVFQEFAKVAMYAAGEFVVTWESGSQDGSSFGVFAQRFSSTGVAIASEFQVNTYTTDDQRPVTVAAGAGSDFVIAWRSWTQDDGGSGVFAQRFAVPKLIDIDGDGAVMPLTDGLLVLRFTFGFTGAVLTSGAVNLGGCTRCDAATIEAYLKTLN